MTSSRSTARMVAGLCWLLAAAAQAAPIPDSPIPGTGLPPPDAPEPAKPEAPPAPKTLPENLNEAVGTWDLSQDGSNRRCVLTLSGDNSRNGRVVRFPAGCRRALPVLESIAGWLYADGGIRLVDANIRPLIRFAPRPDRSSLIGKAENGTTYSLVPLQTVAMLPPAPPAAAPTAPPALRGETNGALADIAGRREIPGSQPVLSADGLHPPAGAPEPGIYALDRFEGKDVCRIALEPRPLGDKTDTDLRVAHLLPGCRDNGIGVFEPVSWRFANGHMTLKARKGHAVNLVAAGEGSWRRDPDIGTTFVLRRVEK